MGKYNIKQQLKGLNSAIVVDSAWKQQKRSFLVATMNAQVTQPVGLFDVFKRKSALAMKPVATFALILVLAFGGAITSVLASGSNPGDVLYSAKLTSEKIHVSLVRNPKKKANLQLQNAKKRVEEIKVVSKKQVPADQKKAIMQKPLDEYKKNMKEVSDAAKNSGKNEALDLAYTLNATTKEVRLSLATLDRVQEEVVSTIQEVQATTAEVQVDAVVLIAKTSDDKEEVKEVISALLKDAAESQVVPVIETTTTEATPVEPATTTTTTTTEATSTEPATTMTVTTTPTTSTEPATTTTTISTEATTTEPATTTTEVTTSDLIAVPLGREVEVPTSVSTLTTEVITEAEKLIEAGDIEKALATIETNTVIVEVENTDITDTTETEVKSE